MVCRRSFSNRKSCLRHENLKHSDYNIAPSNLFEVPENLIFKFKDQIRYEIKKKLSKNHTKIGKQRVELACNEDLFYNILKDLIKRYSPLKRKYICEFQDNSMEDLKNILGNNWDERHYEGIVSYINNNEKVLIEWVEKRIVENNNNITF